MSLTRVLVHTHQPLLCISPMEVLGTRSSRLSSGTEPTQPKQHIVHESLITLGRGFYALGWEKKAEDVKTRYYRGQAYLNPWNSEIRDLEFNSDRSFSLGCCFFCSYTGKMELCPQHVLLYCFYTLALILYGWLSQLE